MPLHRLTSVTIGVPHVEPVAAYYAEFGLSPLGDGRFATVDGGEQLSLVTASRRRLLELGVGVDDPDDLDRVSASLTGLDVAHERGDGRLVVDEPGTEVRVVVEIADRVASDPSFEELRFNGPGRLERSTARAAGVLREGPVRPRKLGHVVVGSTDLAASERFFIDGLGFQVSDSVTGLASFLRCSTDHHNLLVQGAPLPFLHHTSWQVDDVDEIGRGATAMLESDSARHVWGLGRHHIGSNFFWYLRDPAGNFSEYYADLDVIVDDELWQPEVWQGMYSLYRWGPPVPAEFLAPDDLVDLMSATHN